jgi:hypothetical protein
MHARALEEARRWCSVRVDARWPSSSLRSPLLRPTGYPDEWMYGELFADRVGMLIARRRERIADATTGEGDGAIACVLGRLDTAMGEGRVESRGVIDDCYLPPWDTWFACVELGEQSLLLAWIPSVFAADVQAAIDVAATDPLAWLAGPLPAVAEWNEIAPLLADARTALR